MNKELEKKLLYRRQFILCTTDLSDFSEWNKYYLADKYILYAHPDLVQFEHAEKNNSIILLGDLYDPVNTDYNNQEIFERLIKHNDLNDLIEATAKYAGRFIIFFCKNSSLNIFHDASGARKVYYTAGKEPVWCASQPHVLAKYRKMDMTENIQVLDHIKSDKFFSHDQVSILDNTIYDSIKQLLPNHYLDVQSRKPIRFWPNKVNKIISLKEGVEEGSKILSGILKSASKRYELMMAVTAGNDTRLLLAASRDVSDEIFYYINSLLTD